MDGVVFLSGAASAFLFICIMFGVAWRRDRYDLIDCVWGLAFIGAAATAYLSQSGIVILSVQTLVLMLIAIWGMRLSWHIYRRWAKSAKEDKRYAAVREKYKKKPGGVVANMFIRVYMVQAILAIAICCPVFILFSAPAITSLSTVIGAGVAVWLVGFLCESVADAQLAAHVKKARGTLMTTGLWRYSRHPNYFGEVVVWWGIFIVSLATPYWYIALIGPVVITVSILFISGVPMTEKYFEGRPGWKEYKKRTSVFLPLPPKKV